MIIRVDEVVPAIWAVQFQLGLGSFRMNTFVLLPLLDRTVQCSADEHDLRQWYMTVIVVSHGFMKSIRILTKVVRPMINCDEEYLWGCNRRKVKWTLAIR
jgi:hypothetical protein